jgi:hypothetical protein
LALSPWAGDDCRFGRWMDRAGRSMLQFFPLAISLLLATLFSALTCCCSSAPG